MVTLHDLIIWHKDRAREAMEHHLSASSVEERDKFYKIYIMHSETFEELEDLEHYRRIEDTNDA